ncbi:MurR/RpiR family transcriptional regulator [Paucilactobacillus kaifaensis]|uniref:MurR/RpiR family transcriptional regulator n=1 Tax=Paucilactobacillus kaifaensis TaxID=2559921 RepID=UPI0010F900BA|nr:MurR/RpiR family transcriptional regulator [Paucilactobacillus kaifaensis]
MVEDSIVSIKAYYNGFSGNEKRIAEYVIKHAATVQELTISDLAKKCNTSTASISRFVKHIGYLNYREFLMEMPKNTYGDIFSEIEESDSDLQITEKTFNGAINALKATKKMIDKSKIKQASELLRRTKRLGFFGLGGSSIVALDGFHKFLRTSLDCEYHPDFDIQLMQAVKLTDEDCAIVVSHSGRNKQTLLAVQQLQQRHVPIIAITSFPTSELAQNADVALISVAEEVNFRSESMSSLMAQLTIMDSLFMMTAIHHTEQTECIISDVRAVMNKTRA